jgi:hypothetical protein
MTPSLFERLLGRRGVLLAGCGGGFDVVSGLPLLHWLRARGIPVVMGNMSFTHLALACRHPIGPTGWHVDQDCVGVGYFPERVLHGWLQEVGYDCPFIAFGRSGVQRLIASYRAVLERYDLDTILLVDGGTDSLIRGDESLLGTPEEDALSIVAAAAIPDIDVHLACLGFGIDQYHGICHHSFLENVAGQITQGGFLGSISVEGTSPEGQFLLDAVEALNTRQPAYRSIVANSVADAVRGRFGDVHATEATAGSTLFINALMGMYWFFDARRVAQAMIFSDDLRATDTFPEVEAVIRAHHTRADQRPWVSLPL